MNALWRVQSFILDKTDRYAAASIAVAHVHAAGDAQVLAAGTEVEAPRGFGIFGRGRPVTAAEAHAAHASTAIAVARRGQKH